MPPMIICNATHPRERSPSKAWEVGKEEDSNVDAISNSVKFFSLLFGETSSLAVRVNPSWELCNREVI